MKESVKHRHWKGNNPCAIMMCLLPFLFFILNSCQPDNKHIDLSGAWGFKIDSADVGVQQKWYTQTLNESVLLPGSMKENNKGYEPSLTTPWTASIYDSSWYFNPALEKYRTEKPLKFPFWLTPNLHYVGAAWYQKEIDIPPTWDEKSIELSLERPHWESSVWIDTIQVGMQNSLSVPHRIRFPHDLKPGKHLLTIRIDNRLDEVNVGPDSHSVSDHTQGNWNGIVGKIELKALPEVSIKFMHLYPNIDKNMVLVKLLVDNKKNYNGPARLKIEAKSTTGKHKLPVHNYQVNLSLHTDTIEVEFPMGKNYHLWDEFNPYLYKMKATLLTTDYGSHSVESTFGMRKIETIGRQILVNGRPVFLRGNVDNCVFPLTGYPPTDVGSWLSVFSTLKKFGLNHVRFHSWCPPKAAFDAADQLGLYLQPEGPSWANHGTSLGNGRSIDTYIYEETQRIFDEYGNHPSFCLFASGNEPRGNYVAFLDDYLRYWKHVDQRRIYTGASIGGSWQECSENEFHVKGGARGLPWKNRPNSTFDYTTNIERFDKPFITHELGQYCVFPDFTEIPKYTGSYKAYNFELFRDLLVKNNMGDKATQFTNASGELQKICYKYEIEATLRTPGMAGYQMLGLNDFPGQGSAIVGVLNAFYEPKEYVSSGFFTQFCNPLTLLATLPKFVFTNDETLTAGIELANYSATTVEDFTVNWQIMNKQNEELATGNFNTGNVPVGKVSEIGKVSLQLSKIESAQKLTLKCNIGSQSVNQWDFWVYCHELPTIEPNFIIARTFDQQVINTLKNGGDVLLLAAGTVENGKDVVQHFTPVFWNTSWFKMRPPHTTGVLIMNDHPVFEFFPTEFHSNLQWWEILNRQQIMNLENFPAEFSAIVQPIDTWFLSRKLGLLWEAKCSNGRIMVCSADIAHADAQTPAARQLLYSITNYMNSDQFNPQHEISPDIILELFEKKDRSQVKLYTKDSPDELKPNHTKK